MSTRPRGAEEERGQTAPVAVVLILGIVIVGTAVAVVAAATVVGDGQRSLDADRAEQTLSHLDSKISLVGLGNARTQRTSLASMREGGYDLRPDAGWMNVSVTNVTTGDTTTMFNTTLGAIVFENGDRSVAYQGGGVWRGDSDGSLMISPPEFHYRDATMTLPLVTIDGDRTLSGRVTVSRQGSTVQHFPNASKASEWHNPLEHGMVNASVKSQYYRAWGSFWEQRTDGDVFYDHDEQVVTVQLVVPAGNRDLSSALAGTSATGELHMAGSGSDPARTDGYNSSVGSYSSTVTDDGHITTAGDVTLSGNSQVDGGIESGGFVELNSNNNDVADDLYYSDGLNKHSGATVGGDIEQISGVDDVNHIDGYVSRRYEAIADDNDNGPEGSISNNSLVSGDQTLGPGEYHLSDIELDGEVLTLDTTSSGETIEIGVRNHVLLENDAEILVQGSGQVRMFVDGQTTGPDGNHFKIRNGGSAASTVEIADTENASQFWLYGDQDFAATIDGASGGTYKFEGVIYAPGGRSGASSFWVEKADVYGSVVVGEVTVENGGSIHYDQALSTERVVPEGESIVRLTYMHVTETRVNVTG